MLFILFITGRTGHTVSMSKLRNANQEGSARTVAPLGLGEEEVCDGAGQEGRGEAGGGEQQQGEGGSDVQHGHSWSVVSVTAAQCDEGRHT